MIKTAESGFKLVREQFIDSLNLSVEEYHHTGTGAVHYHFASDNPENVFLVALRTVPTDSTGVAHVLEHTALCGSEKYPVRDPFFMMLRRSLNTFMNAFTSSDWTGYPFASQNKKDFNNLLEVYLDAVFFSRLDELDFAQEGWRVEFSEPENVESPLIYKGVVYNEMKGSMSSPVTKLWHTLCTYLYPCATYHFNSGGDPHHIPDLSYNALKQFYQLHYHPSNSVFFTYGDIPASEHQLHFNRHVLSRFEKRDTEIKVKDEKRYASPIVVEESYVYDESDAEHKTHIVLGWLLGLSSDPLQMFTAHLLSTALLDNSASPLLKALETTDLGLAPSPLCGLEDSNREMCFVAGIEGSDPQHAQALEALVFEVLNDVAENGIEQDQLEAALHQLELSQREVSGGSYPYGLQLMLHALPAAIHRGDPLQALNIDPFMETLREAIKDPNFIKRLVREQLLDNPHRVRLTLKPDATRSRVESALTDAQLKAYQARLTDSEKNDIVAQAKNLKARQQAKEKENLLPQVELADIPAEINIAPGKQCQQAPTPVSFYPQGTNGLVYEDVVINMPELPDDLLAILPYYTSCLTELGCGKRDYLQNQLLQARTVGGLSAGSSFRSQVDNEQVVSGHLVLSGKALVNHLEPMTTLLRETLFDVRFDEHDRIRELIAQIRVQRDQSITGSGHVLAMGAASSKMSPVANLSYHANGLAGIAFVDALDDSLSEKANLKAVVEKMTRLHQLVVEAPREFLLVGEAQREQAFLEGLSAGWLASPASIDVPGISLDPVRDSVRELWVTNTQVNFCAKAYPTVPFAHDDAPILAVLGKFLGNGYLHTAIRERGGAYGAGAMQVSDLATFRFFSYRDPRLLETLDEFDRALDWLCSNQHADEQLPQAIIGVIAGLDKPSSPAGEAKKAYYNHRYSRDRSVLERFRQGVLATTIADLQRVASQYLQPDQASIAVITHAGQVDACKGLGCDIHRL